MSVKIKNRIIVITSAVLAFTLSLLFVVLPKSGYSDSERRPLEKFPEISWESIVSGKFMGKFDTYSVENFPFRDGFRGIKALASKYLFMQLENNDLYVDKDGYVVKIQFPNEESVDNAVKKLNVLYEKYLKDSNAKVYLSIVPDKNYFADDFRLKPDYAAMVDTVKNGMSYAQYVDLFSVLEIDDYYKTDTHWKQEALVPAAKQLANAMGVQLSGDFTEHTASESFNGVYVGQAALPLKPDTIKYLTNDAIDRAVITLYDNNIAGEEMPMYDETKLDGKDGYEFFLGGGNLGLIKITDPDAQTDRKLVIFRDSYGSAIAPLLTGAYSEITVIDTRRVNPMVLGMFVDFTDADVLFLYSSLVLCDSSEIK
jgi:hypothetical protein